MLRKLLSHNNNKKYFLNKINIFYLTMTYWGNSSGIELFL